MLKPAPIGVLRAGIATTSIPWASPDRQLEKAQPVRPSGNPIRVAVLLRRAIPQPIKNKVMSDIFIAYYKVSGKELHTARTRGACSMQA